MLEKKKKSRSFLIEFWIIIFIFIIFQLYLIWYFSKGSIEKSEKIICTINKCKCKKSEKKFLGIINIFSKPRNYEERQLIRQTYVNDIKKNQNVEYKFIIGMDDNFNEIVLNEIDKYNDILLIDVYDAAKNSTNKHLTSLNYVYQCLNVDYLIKVDDNVLINIRNLIQYLKGNNENLLKGEICSIKENSQNSRFSFPDEYLNHDDFSKDFYPKHCNSFAYITSFQMVWILVRISQLYQNYSTKDSVFLSGIINEIINGDLINFPNNSISEYDFHFKKDKVMFFHPNNGIMNKSLWINIWNELNVYNSS